MRTRNVHNKSFKNSEQIDVSMTRNSANCSLDSRMLRKKYTYIHVA